MPSIARLFNFVAGTPAVADEVDAELNQLIATINALDAANIVDGSLTNAEIAAAAAIAVTKMGIVPACRVRKTSNITIAASGSLAAALAFDSEAFDTDNIHSTVTNTSRLTAQTAGLYWIYGVAEWSFGGTNARVGCYTRLNGATLIDSQTEYTEGSSVANTIAIKLGTPYQLAVGDYVEMVPFNNNAGGVAATIESQSAYSPVFGMVRIGRTV